VPDDSRPHRDQQIISGLRSGDVNAWNALCDQFGDRVWRFLVRLVGPDEAVVGDLFQETFLAAAKSGRNLSANTTRLWNWLARIAHNLSADYWRAVYRDRRLLRAEPNQELITEPTGFGDPVELMFRGETVDAVRSVLAEMSSDHVAVLVAKYVDGESVVEIVDELGGTVEGIRSRLARARREFKSKFERLHSIEQAD
jgi:RNA polymerase sigma-70 factor, ECF subfamily